jgi:hypothetical protein
MRLNVLLNITLLLGVTACEFKVTPDDTDTSDESTGSGASESAGTTSGGSDGSGQTSNSGGSSVGTTTEGTTGMSTATATATSTSTTTEMTSSTTSATSASTSATTDGPPPDPIDPTPCEGEAKVIPGDAIAYLEAQVPPPPPPDTTGGSGTTGGDPIDPGTLHVRLSSQSFTCEDPAAALKCGQNWAVSFALAPEFQIPGLYHLSGPSVFGVGTETGPDEGNGECSWGGGSFFATLEVISVDDENVIGRLCHIDAPIPSNAAELEGKFVAPRCP